MTINDWVFLALVSGAVLGLIFTAIVIGVRVKTKTELKALGKKKSRSRRRSKQQRVQQRQLTKVVRRQLKLLISLVVLTITLSAGAVGFRYYSATHLNQQDSELIVKAYYLLEKAEKQLVEGNQGDNPEKARNNLRQAAAGMASFGVHRASGRLTLTAQQSLNRYYFSVKELGLNLANQSSESLQNNQVFESYLADIEKTKAMEKNLFEMFKVNEEALASKK